MYLCDQNDILYQARTTFESVLENKLSFGYFHGQEKKVHNMDGVFASFQTMGQHFRSFDPKAFEYIVVDESHHSQAQTYRSVIEYFTPDWLLGVTATPDRLDGLDIRDLYGPELFYLPLEVAMANGLLTPVDYRLLADEMSIDAALARPGSKISVSELNKRIFVEKGDEEIAAIIARHAAEFADPRIIVFTSSLDKCDKFCESMPGSLAIHSRVPMKERNIRMELFRQGMVTTAVTVDCFNEGIDIPQANVLAFLRSTESPNIFSQQLGRGLRRFQGKDRVIALDFVANCERIKMVQSLWKKVEGERARRESGNGPRWQRSERESQQASSQSGSRLHFNEKVIKVLDLLEGMRPKYVSEIPRLAKDYSSKNITTADRVYARTSAILWWECHKCHYEWQASGIRRLSGSKCPACEGKVVTAENNLAFCFPQLVKEYSAKNELPATQVTPHSSHTLRWQCTDATCGYEWDEIGASRVRRFAAGHGCPECFERSTLNTLSIERHDLFQQYSARNILPSPVPWWQCDKCGHEWRGRTAARLKKGVGCPVCSGRIASKETQLDLVYPDLAAELEFTHLAPNISIHSNRDRYWLCPYCAHKWWASVRQRIADRSCPRCHNPKKESEETIGPSVAEHPVLSNEYSERNSAGAAYVSQGSTAAYWWVCRSCGFAYMASPRERLHEAIGCPVCSALDPPSETQTPRLQSQG